MITNVDVYTVICLCMFKIRDSILVFVVHVDLCLCLNLVCWSLWFKLNKISGIITKVLHVIVA